jgi:hypothetical protein
MFESEPWKYLIFFSPLRQWFSIIPDSRTGKEQQVF